MTLGYLHVGASEHGVHRYGALLAQAARGHLEGDVQEAKLTFSGTAQDAGRIDAALNALAEADVLHVQYEPAVWGGSAAAQNVTHFVRHVQSPYVVTVHDARDGYGVAARLKRLWAARNAAQSSRKGTGSAEKNTSGGYAGTAPWTAGYASMRRAWQFWHLERSNAQATRQMMHGAAAALVCTAPEQQRLAAVSGTTPLAVIPHFVEARALPDATAARAALGLADAEPVVTVLGFIHRQKGHDRVLRALPHLPDTAQLLFVGAPSDGEGRFASELRVDAEALGVAERMRITGYVDETTLNRYLAATDVAVCPFREAAASGSLSTWIAAGRPLVVSDLPLFAPYQAAAPEAVRIVADAENGAAWADAIRDQHATLAAGVGSVGALRNLQTRLALPTIIQRHMRWYTRAAPAS
ncbi:hypothetical protein CRI93_08945 [Longimonas halophila]|uniref:Glycosyl transferase family 1 domain-containing protein n=1 Tax=Longimonas halophila TaxID=1469170 RepID=A0A2H3NLD3_9BACT|nr:glycosyltransferase family 4 protein [Longimonas halophila]PEN06754.1 hypothetical protein CRI93_08945 [Longimonas halophila]